MIGGPRVSLSGDLCDRLEARPLLPYAAAMRLISGDLVMSQGRMWIGGVAEG